MTMQALIRVEDRRGAPRETTDKPAEIEAAGSGRVISATVKDISDTGAGLVVTEAAVLPATFDLLIVPDQKLYRVALRWRKANRVGVEFIGTPRHVAAAI